MPAVTEEETEKKAEERPHEQQNGASNGESNGETSEDQKSKRPSTAELLHLKEIVERGEFAGPSIIETVQCEKEMEEKAFQKLITENVSLHRELRKTEAELAEVKHKYDVKFVELDSQKDQTEDMHAQVKHLEKQLEKYRRRKHYEDNEKDGEELVIPDELEMKETVRDLQLRLVRKARDEELKDQRMYALEHELKIEKAVCEDLTEILGDNGKQKEEEFRKKREYEAEHGKQHVVRDQKHNVVNSGNQQSKVCVIM